MISPPSRSPWRRAYAQVTVNDLVIARYTADAWRGRVYAVRYFLTFAVSGVAVWSIGFLYGRGGFDLVLWSTVGVALGLAGTCLVIAFLVNDVERAPRRGPAGIKAAREPFPAREAASSPFQSAFLSATSGHASPAGTSARR